MDVSAEVLEEVLGRAERLFDVDVPTFFLNRLSSRLKLARSARGAVLPGKISFC